MASTKESNTWHPDMKAHVDGDTKDRGQSVATTPASVHVAQVMGACLNSEEKAIYPDQGRK